MDRTERFYRIDQLISERKLVTFAEMIEALEVSPATLKRDIQYLRDRLNCPLIWDPEARGYSLRMSVGVVTFNRKQADLIEEELELRAQIDPVFREAYRIESERKEDGEDMGVFVKNVENVQGDERDVIIFSSTFGRNKQGTFIRNFGVLGQKGGERRLNVAVTRSRRKVFMVTSMPIAEISDLLTTRHPPRRRVTSCRATWNTPGLFHPGSLGWPRPYFHALPSFVILVPLPRWHGRMTASTMRSVISFVPVNMRLRLQRRVMYLPLISPSSTPRPGYSCWA